MLVASLGRLLLPCEAAGVDLGAALLFVSRKMVEAHLTCIYRKLHVRSRTDLRRLLTAADLVD
ncbi:LuxR C-terminal-related transcriptional regulator [Streptomyces sp. BE133]|uniref:LuxR C-terminal-related transcriptional regulator n=1 Tax=Streptomyces sp. BE133 TaxID=3002523 RepID=UPI002E7A682D|nr:LuxR C-terminal-related transcriptional regulator [Streptomyces sp. BE133]MEE1806728.1 LuxR C-terminal-related transcriptional regulator [Streptomyces sp. BE133]